jgi:GNAT superfamily N-acetyltransferase
MKDSHNLSRYCPICSENPKSPPRSKCYDLSLLNFAASSISLREKLEPEGSISYRVTTEADSGKIDTILRDLMQSDRSALGFIPAGGDEGIKYLIDKGRVAVAEANGAIVGYAAFTLRDVEGFRSTLKLQQVCVSDRYRLRGIGRSLVEFILGLYPEHLPSCNVRTDLPANDFWASIGFTIEHSFRHKTSGSMLNHFVKEAAQ